MKMKLLAAAAALVVVAAPAMASQAVTNLSSPVPAGTSFGILAGENSGDATAEISASTVLEANGSLHIGGNRVRVQTGVQYGGFPGLPTNMGILASELVSLTGDYLVTNAGTAGIQSPAFRVYLNNDAGVRTELIWEAVYNGGYTLNVQDSAVATDLFWRYDSACNGFIGTTGCKSGSYVMHTVEDWGDLLGDSWFVSGIGIGAGGGAGAAFDAYADNLTLATTNQSFGTKSYDFQAAAVPEPATWGLMLFGFGIMGAGLRRSRTRVAFAA